MGSIKAVRFCTQPNFRCSPDRTWNRLGVVSRAVIGAEDLGCPRERIGPARRLWLLESRPGDLRLGDRLRGDARSGGHTEQNQVAPGQTGVKQVPPPDLEEADLIAVAPPCRSREEDAMMRVGELSRDE